MGEEVAALIAGGIGGKAGDGLLGAVEGAAVVGEEGAGYGLNAEGAADGVYGGDGLDAVVVPHIGELLDGGAVAFALANDEAAQARAGGDGVGGMDEVEQVAGAVCE